MSETTNRVQEIKNQSIWKAKNEKRTCGVEFRSADIAVLELSVRSYNCLKRAGCTTIGDVLRKIGEDEGEGLRRIRNLGKRSEVEIIERIKAYHADCLRALENGTVPGVTARNSANTGSDETAAFGAPGAARRSVLVKPPRKVWNHSIEEFHLSGLALAELHDCGITYIRDLYTVRCAREPGWYAVRELFEKI